MIHHRVTVFCASSNKVDEAYFDVARKLGLVLVPIILLNANHFFDPFLDMLDKMVAEKFMRKIHRNIWQVIHNPEDIVRAIEQAPAWDGSAIKFAPA